MNNEIKTNGTGRNLFDFATEHPISTVIIASGAFETIRYAMYAVVHFVETRILNDCNGTVNPPFSKADKTSEAVNKVANEVHKQIMESDEDEESTQE